MIGLINEHHYSLSAFNWDPDDRSVKISTHFFSLESIKSLAKNPAGTGPGKGKGVGRDFL